MDCGFQVLDSSPFQWNLDSGFQSLVGFRNFFLLVFVCVCVCVFFFAVFRIPKTGFLDPGVPYFGRDNSDGGGS